MQLRPIPDKISVQHDDEFFIGLGKQGVHSFVFLGVKPRGSDPVLLGRVGKLKNDNDSCSMCWTTLLGCQASELFTEPRQLKSEVNYMAYSINYQHFRQFINLMAIINAKKQQSERRGPPKLIHCCYPSSENQGVIQLNFGPIPPANGSSRRGEANVIDHTNFLNRSNTCRHTAIDITEYTLGNTKTTKSISRFFLSNFPLRNPTKQLYLFPLPPTAYDATGEKLNRLNKIYHRMEQLVKLQQFNEVTYAKFDALKTLYLEQAGIAAEDLHTALTSIQIWQYQFSSLINTRRNSGLFEWLVPRTATAKMADEIERELVKGWAMG